jgi:hypothetical protein
MRIALRLAFDEEAAVRLLNWLAQENARIWAQSASLPLLYDSGVIYQLEQDETWTDYLTMLTQGWEDCDSLAAARAGELLALGHRALREGDAGFSEAQRVRPKAIEAEVYLTTRTKPGVPGLYHCVTRYRLGRRWFTDDPSARLGMNGGQIDPIVKRRWAQPPEPRWRTA